MEIIGWIQLTTGTPLVRNLNGSADRRSTLGGILCTRTRIKFLFARDHRRRARARTTPRKPSNKRPAAARILGRTLAAQQTRR